MSEEKEEEHVPDLSAPPGGRPLKFTDLNELIQKVDAYFAYSDPHIETQKVKIGTTPNGSDIVEEKQVLTKQRPYTVTGLARFLGVSRKTLNNYRDPSHFKNLEPEQRQEYLHTISAAVQRIEEYAEESLYQSGLANGVKFNLTNNFGWEDKKVVDENVKDVTKTLDDLDDEKKTLADEAKKELESDGSGPKATE